MKRIFALLIALAMLTAALPSLAEEAAAYAEAPMLAERVAAGELPPVEQRLPADPKLTDEILPEYLDYEIGNYGGTMRFITSQINWDSDVFIACNEGFLCMESANSSNITPNVVGAYEVNADNTEFTFTLREGLKWSDGEPVTMEDYRFGFEDFLYNTELNPVMPAYMCDGGVPEGTPVAFEVLNDTQFKLTFEHSYGGFLAHISVSRWKGYTDMLKPAHYLKRFHKDYAVECHGSEEAYWAFLQPYAEAMGYENAQDEGVWVNVFSQVDCTNWELTDPNDALTSVFFVSAGETQNFPVLYPWLMVSSEDGFTTWERNPYYHKVDAAGQQLPYVDYLTSKTVEDMEMVQMAYISGEADFARESATIDNVTMYKENEAKAGITTYVTPTHNNPSDLCLNANCTDEVFRNVVNDIRFRQALAHAIDPEEIIENVYNGLASVNPYYPCDHNIDQANSLLDEMGMADIDGDGWRETPEGEPFYFSLYNAHDANDIIPVSELYCAYFAEIGLHVDVKTIESSLLSTMTDAGEVPARVIWITSNQLWHNMAWDPTKWCPFWFNWYNTNGAAGEEPPEDIYDFLHTISQAMLGTPEEALNEVMPDLVTRMGQTLYVIEPITEVNQCVLVNSDIGNVPTGGVGISWNYAVEQMFYRSIG